MCVLVSEAKSIPQPEVTEKKKKKEKHCFQVYSLGEQVHYILRKSLKKSENQFVFWRFKTHTRKFCGEARLTKGFPKTGCRTLPCVPEIA